MMFAHDPLASGQGERTGGRFGQRLAPEAGGERGTPAHQHHPPIEHPQRDPDRQSGTDADARRTHDPFDESGDLWRAYEYVDGRVAQPQSMRGW